MERSGLSSSISRLTRIRIPERGFVDISADIWGALEKTDGLRRLHEDGVVSATYLPGGQVRLKGTCYVGHAICGDILLDFHEKIEGALAALLSFSTHDTFRVTRVDSATSDLGSLIVLLVRQFLASVTAYASRGRLFNYSTVQSIGSLVGGRLNLTKSIQLRARGLGHLLAFAKNTITYRLPINKVVLVALREVEKLARLMPFPPEVVARARGLAMLFADCRDHETLYRERGHFVELAQRLGSSSLPEEVLDMLVLASVVLAHESFENTGGHLAGAPRTWFLNLETLFELAVRKSLSELCSGRFDVSRGSDNPPPIFNGEFREYRAHPDVVIWQARDVIAVGDVKYKNWDGSAAASDVYQLITHTGAFSGRQAFLLFPSERFDARHLGGTNDGIETWFFAVDVRNLAEDLKRVLIVLGLMGAGAGGTLPLNSSGDLAVETA